MERHTIMISEEDLKLFENYLREEVFDFEFPDKVTGIEISSDDLTIKVKTERDFGEVSVGGYPKAVAWLKERHYISWSWGKALRVQIELSTPDAYAPMDFDFERFWDHVRRYRGNYTNIEDVRNRIHRDTERFFTEAHAANRIDGILAESIVKVLCNNMVIK
jgi:hypothetical protein